MYITYCRNQRPVDLEDKTSYRLGVTGGDYRPTRLIRVSDWEKVPGEEAVDGYHTLSYCWEQSGEAVKRAGDGDEYDIIDNGEHCIVEGYDVDEDLILSECFCELIEAEPEAELDPAYKEKDDKYVTSCVPMSKTTTLRHVTYEDLQQLCNDFQVEYLWYDKVCIDQSDKKHKFEEITQMHNIYRNARYTVALISEVALYDTRTFDYEIAPVGTNARCLSLLLLGMSRWWTRTWTLEEVMVSRHILIVGTDTNMFQHSLHSIGTPPTGLDVFSETLLDASRQIEENGGSINQALTEAHFRTSTKPHDRIFALANIFVHIFDEFEINYSTNVQEVFNKFYRHVATEDLSILCFGSNLAPSGRFRLLSTMGDYSLPSWTGIAGWHIRERVDVTTHPQLTYTIDDSMRVKIKTNRYWKIPVTRYKNGPYGAFLEGDTPRKREGFVLQYIRDLTSARFEGKWANMSQADMDTILMEWCTEISIRTKLYMTHYHYDIHEHNFLTQLRPLSLTADYEGKECIVLPILLESRMLTVNRLRGYNYVAAPYESSYLLPVFCKCPNSTSGQYKAVGTYFVGIHRPNKLSPTLNWNHCIRSDDLNAVQNPADILNTLKIIITM